MDTFKVGLLGLGRGGQQLCAALLSSSWCELVAVASPKTDRLERFVEEHPGISAYDDFRSLIVESHLDILFMAIPPYERLKYFDLAVERGLPVWMLGPAARRIDEAVEVMRKFERADCPLVVSRSWGFEPALCPEAIDISQLGHIFFARGNMMTCWTEDLDWRGDSHRAGGGVLLDRGYSMLDTAVQLMGFPNSVHAVASGVSRPAGPFPYDTEDTIALTCKFSGGSIGVFSGCWTAGPERWELEFYGTESSVQIDESRVILLDRPGHNRTGEHVRPANPFVPQLEEFFEVFCSDPKKLRSTLGHHL
ncbi:MAG: Gfo/Idh/MocA family protein, partial [Planctomycetota bacterium]